MPRLCQFKDIFGKPREGPHALRVFDFAIVDIVLTVMLAFLIKFLTGFKFLPVLVFLFILAIFLHWLFCVDTKLNNLLGL